MKFLKEFSIRKLLYNKRFTIPFSILIAFTLWLIVTINQKPIMERTFTDVTVTINLENTRAAENGMSIIGDISEQKFTVVVRGSSYLVSSLTASDLSLYASAAAVDAPGDYNLEVAVASTASEYEILSISPPTVSVNFDYIETKEFTIEASAVGATAEEGLIAEPAVVSGTQSNTLTIKGPRTVINKIERVVAEAEVNKTLSASGTFDSNIVLYDANSELIDTTNLTLSTANAKVTVPISKKKTIPVVVEFSNLPQGFNKSTLKTSIDHPTVTIIGTPETVDKTSQLSLTPIDISIISLSSASFDVSPKLPEGVRLLDAIDHFTVTVNTADYVEKTFNLSSVSYTGLSSGLSASGSKIIRNVKICGPKSVVNNINVSKILATVDLTDKKSGEHSLPVTFKVDGYANVWIVGTYTTTVTIK